MGWCWLQTGWQGLQGGQGHIVSEATADFFTKDSSTDRQWQHLCTKLTSPPSSPSFQTGLTSPTPSDLSQNILLFLSLCHYTFSCLLPIFPDTPVLEFLSSLTGLLLGPVWVGWAGWTQGVLGADRATTLPPLGPALLTQRRASWCLRITGGRWVRWCTRLILFIILFTYELLYCILHCIVLHCVF